MGHQSAQILILATMATASLATWGAIVARWRRGETLVPFERRRPVPWTIWDVLLVAIAVFLVPDMCLVAVGQILHVPQDQWLLDPRLMSLHQGARLLVVALVIPLLRFSSRARISDLGLGLGQVGSDAWLGARAFFAAFFPVLGSQLLLTQWLDSEHPVQKLLKAHHEKWVFLAMGIVAVVIAPLLEEFLFRVVLQGWLEALDRRLRRGGRHWPLRPGFMPICASSLLFAAMHAGYGPDPVPIFILALFLGYLYWRTHRIWPSVAAHCCLNALSMCELLLSRSAPMPGGP